MNENKTIFRNPVFNIAVISGCIITTVLLAFDDEPLYSSVALLPLFYMIVYMLHFLLDTIFFIPNLFLATKKVIKRKPRIKLKVNKKS